MKYKLLLITFFASLMGWGQVAATSSTSLTTTSSVIEQFANTSGANAYTTGFPTSWSLSAASNQTATPSSSSTTGGWYAGNDIGFLGSGSASNGNATWRLQNNTNSQITGFSLSFKAKMYKSGSNSPSVQVFYSTNSTGTIPAQGSTGFTAISSLTVGDVSTFSNTVNTSGVTLSTSPSNNITGLTLANTDYLYIRFIFSGGSSSDLFSIDDVTITPILAVSSYTVAFDKNAVDASGSMMNQTASGSTSLLMNTFTRSGYYFSGWNTVADGTGVSYSDGATYAFTSDVTLYAQWQIPTWNGSSWSNSVVPTSSLNAIVDGDLTTTADLACKDLTINSGKTLTIGAGKKLTVAANLINNGTIIFKSDATGTAMFDVFNGTQSGTGVVTVERFIPQGKRAFRLLSPAVNTTGSISNNWQLGTHITGGLGAPNLGFDVTETNNPSMFTYNNQIASGTGWTAIANTNATNLTAGVGYRVLIRGDRNVDLNSQSNGNMNASVTLAATGTLKTGSVVLNDLSTPAINNTSNTTTANYSLVGNPYASAIDWHAVTKSGIDDTYYAWDPNLGTGNDRGRYVSYTQSSNTTSILNGSGTTYIGRYIQSGQAFFVKNSVSGTPGTLTFNESNKSTTQAAVFRSANTELAKMYLTLYDATEFSIGGYPIDGTVAVFGQDFETNLGAGDVQKLETNGQNVMFLRDNKKLAIEATSLPVSTDELQVINTNAQPNKNYTWRINMSALPSTVTPYLVDAFLGTQTALSVNQEHIISFATTDAVASTAPNRFKIVFTTSALHNDTFTTQIGLYPNPSKGNVFNLQLPSSAEVSVKLFNTLGQEIGLTNNGSTYHAVQSLPTGMYYIKVTQGAQTSKLKWIVE